MIAIAYCFAVRANQFTKKIVRRSACSLWGEGSRQLRMLYILSVTFVNEFLFGDFCFSFYFYNSVRWHSVNDYYILWHLAMMSFMISCYKNSVEWGKMWACFNVWRVYLSRGSIVSVTEECFWFAYCKCVDVQFDWLCDIRRYVDVLPAFCSSVVSYSMVKESSDFVKRKKIMVGWSWSLIIILFLCCW